LQKNAAVPCGYNEKPSVSPPAFVIAHFNRWAFTKQLSVDRSLIPFWKKKYFIWCYCIVYCI